MEEAEELDEVFREMPFNQEYKFEELRKNRDFNCKNKICFL